MVAAGNDNLFRRLCAAIGRPGLAEEARFRTNADRVVNRRELIPILYDIFAAAPIAVWAERLDAAGIPNSPIQTLDKVVTDEQTAALGIIQQWAGSSEFRWSGCRCPSTAIRPRLCQSGAPARRGQCRDRRSWRMSRGLGRCRPRGSADRMRSARPAGTSPRSRHAAAKSPPAREDSSQRFIGVIGPKAQHAPPFLGSTRRPNFYCLRSFVDRRTGEMLHQLYVTDSYFGVRARWNAARDSAGHSLRFVAIGRRRD